MAASRISFLRDQGRVTLTAAVVGSDVQITWTAEDSLAWTWRVGSCDVILLEA